MLSGGRLEKDIIKLQGQMDHLQETAQEASCSPANSKRDFWHLWKDWEGRESGP